MIEILLVSIVTNFIEFENHFQLKIDNGIRASYDLIDNDFQEEAFT